MHMHRTFLAERDGRHVELIGVLLGREDGQLGRGGEHRDSASNLALTVDRVAFAEPDVAAAPRLNDGDTAARAALVFVRELGELAWREATSELQLPVGVCRERVVYVEETDWNRKWGSTEEVYGKEGRRKSNR